jgi:alpha-galactosidase
MEPPKIVMIGAGSAFFGLHTLAGLMAHEDLHGSRLALVDLDAQGLAQLKVVAQRLSQQWNADFDIQASTDRREVLKDADFVVLSVAVDREETWRLDCAIAERHGLKHYGENGGPGGFFHTARNLANILPILQDIERLAPAALLINYTNPLPRICRAIQLSSDLRFVGLCHQLRFGYLIAGIGLADEMALDIPRGYTFRWTDESMAIEHRVADAMLERIDIRGAGLNHFTWMLEVRDKTNQKDLLPLLRHNLQHKVHTRFEPLTRHIAQVTGLIPVSGDTHLCEYLPFTRSEGWQRYEIQAYDHDWSEGHRRQHWRDIASLAQGQGELDKLRQVTSERVEEVIAASWHDTGAFEPAVNIPNAGAIANLPDDAIVEVPGRVRRHSISGCPQGVLPGPIAEWCRRENVVADLCVRACLNRSRELALEAFILDPMTLDLAQATSMLDDYLATFGDRLGGPWL